MNGPAVDEFIAGKVYLLHTWATWSGPARVGFKQIGKLASKFEGRVQFVGLNTGGEQDKTVRAFLQSSLGAVLSHPQAFGSSGQSAAGPKLDDWFKHFPIPTVFIVDSKGRIAWIGLVGEVEAPLTEIVNGTYDVAKVIEQRAETEKKEKREKDGSWTSFDPNGGAHSAKSPQGAPGSNTGPTERDLLMREYLEAKAAYDAEYDRVEAAKALQQQNFNKLPPGTRIIVPEMDSGIVARYNAAWQAYVSKTGEQP
jgi:hypothetical protein